MHTHTHMHTVTHTQSISASHGGKLYTATQEPLTLSLPPSPGSLKDLQLSLEFHGHYGEEPLAVGYDAEGCVPRVYRMEYDVVGRSWTLG